MGLLDDSLKEAQELSAHYLDLMQRADALSAKIHEENIRLMNENHRLMQLNQQLLRDAQYFPRYITK